MKTTVGKSIMPELPILHPQWTSYTNGNFVNDLFVHGNMIWAATSGGAVRWDMQSNEYVKFTTEYGLASNKVTRICMDRNGTCWFATPDSGLCALKKDNTWAYYNQENLLDSNRICAMLLAVDDSLWISTPFNVYRCDPSGQWHTYNFSHVVEMYQSRDGRLWFGLFENGVLCLDSDLNETLLNVEQNLGKHTIYAIYQTSDDAMWFGGYESGLRRLDKSGEWSAVLDNERDYYGITTMVQDVHDTMWFGAFDGIRCLSSDGEWTKIVLIDEIGSTSDLSISVIKKYEDRLWLGLYGQGILQDNNGDDFVCYLTNDEFVSNRIQAINEDTSSALWFGSGGSGVGRLTSDGKLHIFTRLDGLLHDNVRTICPGRDGTVWFGSGAHGRTTTGGISRFTPENHWSSFGETDKLSNQYVQSLIQRHDDSIWFAVGVEREKGGVHCLYPDGTWETIRHNQLLYEGILSPNYNQVNVIFESKDRLLWFGLQEGILCFDSTGKWYEFTHINDLSIPEILGIAQSTDDTLWFAAGGLILNLTPDKKWAEVELPQQFEGEITSICTTHDGAVWFGVQSYFGVSKCIYRFAPDRTWTTFGTGDGMASNSVRTIFQSRDGSMWFGTDGGVSRYRPFIS